MILIVLKIPLPSVAPAIAVAMFAPFTPGAVI
jgi:hypothetical protein